MRMLAAARTFLRVLARHWSALLTWFFIGEVVHQLFMHLAAYVGAYSSLGGLLILPLAVLGRLVAYVAMFLTVRSSMPSLLRVDRATTALVAATPAARERRGEFTSAVLVSILPFLTFYAAWGLLDEDRLQFSRLARDWLLRNELFSDSFTTEDRLGAFTFGFLPVAVVLAALLVRVITGRLGARLPLWTAPVSVYAETVWVFLLFTFVSQQLAVVRVWLETRVAISWANDLGDWFAQWIPPVSWAWEWLGQGVGLIGPAILLPLAWITIAGVIYTAKEYVAGGDAIAPPKPGLVSRLRTIGAGAVRRIDELRDAVVFVLRAGPIPAGWYLVAFAVWAMFARLLEFAVLRSWGPNGNDFWSAYGSLLLMVAAAISTPLMIALIAAVYNEVLALTGQASRLDAEGEHAGDVGVGELDAERAGGIAREDEHRLNVVPAGLIRAGHRRSRRSRRRR